MEKTYNRICNEAANSSVVTKNVQFTFKFGSCVLGKQVHCVRKSKSLYRYVFPWRERAKDVKEQMTGSSNGAVNHICVVPIQAASIQIAPCG